MKKVVVTVISVIVALFLIAGAVIGISLIHKYMPSKEVTKETDWYGVSGDQVAVVYRDTLQDVKGLYEDGQIYLPLAWVSDHLNQRFYWDSEGQQLIYTLPDSIVYAGLETTGSSGAKLIKKAGDDVYLLTGIIAAYTDIRQNAFLDTAAKRLFIDDRWSDTEMSATRKEAAVREKGGIKSPVLTTLPKGDNVTVLETMENWSMVRTADGFVGYLENKHLGEVAAVPQVSSFQAPVYTNISLDEEISMVWHHIRTTADNEKLNPLLVDTQGINVISPTWFQLSDDFGNFYSMASKAYVTEAHERGIQVWAAVDNFNYEKGKDVHSEILFAGTESRRQLIENLIAEVKEYEIDGINMDIEGIKPEAGPHYVQFIRELSIACRKEGIVLSVDNYVPTPYTSFYNREEQGQVVDYVIIMAYDEHTPASGMGSVSSFEFVKNGIADTMKAVPKEKIICGLPFYTRLWKDVEGEVTSDDMGISGAINWINEKGVEMYWQEELGQYYGELTEGDTKYMLWMEESESLTKKLEEVRGQGLAGAAYWKLGLEPASVWDVVKP